MAAEDAFLQEMLYYRIGPSLIIFTTIYYFRSFIKHHTYDRIYARLLNTYGRGMNKAFKSEKTEMFDNLSKMQANLNRNLSVMEIGAGSAPNIHLFPAGTEIVCLEPNPHFNKYIEKNLKSTKTEISEVTVVQGYAEDINVEDERFDAVVCTFVLCTVESPSKTLSEIKRVLKPGGLLLFLEHVAADDGTILRRFQGILNPLWKIIGDGCHVSRETGDMIAQAGFSSTKIRKFRSAKWRVPPFLKPCVMGVAVK